MRTALAAFFLGAAFATVSTSGAAAAGCEPKPSCFGFESVDASISSHQAGGHPDLSLSFALKQDPSSPPNAAGLHQPYAPVRDVRIETPPGLLGDPNTLGESQQCTVQALINYHTEGCPNGSQVGTSKIVLYGNETAALSFTEPIYMMTPPGGNVVARLGLIGGVYPTFIDLSVRSADQSDFGLTTSIDDTAPVAEFVEIDSTVWGVPAAPQHDTERCTPAEAFEGCAESIAKPPGGNELSFLINPTSCPGTGGEVEFSVDSWSEPGRWVEESATLPPITGCDKVPFNPSLFAEPTSHRAATPTGLELSFRLPAPKGVGVLESSDLKDLRIDFPPGTEINTSSADGLGTCSAEQVGFGTTEPSHCPDSAKLGETEFDIPALPRRMKGAIYLREPEPHHLFRIWVVADDLGAHVKLPGELEVDESTGQIHSVVLDLPQVPVREVKLALKSGFRAPLVNPPACGTYQTHYAFTPWARPYETVEGETPMHVTAGCDTGRFSPKLEAGSTNPAAGKHAPFIFALSREDGEQNPASLDVALPRGLVATFAGVPRCEGAAAETGACPVGSQIGRVLAATGAGPTPLWTPEPGKRPTAVYLGGPYKGAPLSAIAVVPAQAGPFDLGNVVVRSAIYVDPETAQATVKSDSLPQFIQGIPILYRVTEVILDRQNFTLNPTNCSPRSVAATVRSTHGAVATPSAYFQAADCASLPFKPKLSLKLKGGTKRGGHPSLHATVKMPAGEANIAKAQVTLPRSQFLDQGHIRTVCTRVQFVAKSCPQGSVYGHAVATSPLFDFPLEGDAILRSSSHQLPDLVLALHGPPSFPIEVDVAGRIDSVNGGIRTSFETIPDAPVSKFTLQMQGGKKGLLQNSTDLCASVNRATAKFTGQNGKVHDFNPVLANSCEKKAKKAKRHVKHRR